MTDILSKIKRAGLVGRGGAGFFVADKWQAVKRASGDKKFAVCNAAEGEPGVLKDGCILEHYADRVIDGMKIALNFLKAEKAYLYLNHAYHKRFKRKLAGLIKGLSASWRIEIFIKPVDSGYIGGEESAVLNAIAGRRVEPRLKPPFPTESGLWGYPTLINNVETFYNVSLVAAGQFKHTRFYTVSGDCPDEGVFELPDNFTIARVLKQTKNFPKFPFFIQVGGGVSGEIFNSKQLRRPVTGAGAITVYSLAKNNFKKVISNWLEFYVNESCGQCTPCREGFYRLRDVFLKDKVDWRLFNDLVSNLSDASFCALGASAAQPIKSLIKNVYANEVGNKNKN